MVLGTGLVPVPVLLFWSAPVPRRIFAFWLCCRRRFCFTISEDLAGLDLISFPKYYDPNPHFRTCAIAMFPFQ